MKLEELRNFFTRLANIAAVETLPFFRSELKVEDKADDGTFDPVTRIDRQTEMALVAEILKQYPDHSILGAHTRTDLVRPNLSNSVAGTLRIEFISSIGSSNVNVTRY